MNTLQLRRVLSRDAYTRKYFLDVFPSDHLPSEIQRYPACFVANDDASTDPGSHWVAFYVSGPNEVEFFDSYGNEPSFYAKTLSDFASRFSILTYNPLTLQSNISAVCGQYCIYYLYSRCRGRSLGDILSSFVTNNVCNDFKVYDFVMKRFSVRTSFFQ